MSRSFAGHLPRRQYQTGGIAPKRPSASRRLAWDWELDPQRTAGNQAVAGLLDDDETASGTSTSGEWSGQPLEPATRLMMEARLGHDLTGVRVHSDQSAARSARHVGAQAFTVGEDVVLGATAPPLQTRDGQRLLAHELAHVVQQRRGGPAPGRGPASASEAAADAVASAVAAGRTPPPIAHGTAVGIARQTDPRHARGYAGEQGMGFEVYPASEGWIFFEGPSGAAGHGVTTSGFDGVAYNTRTGELHLVDNKSLKSQGNVRSATAIDPSRNLPQNVDALIGRVEAAKDVPGRIRILGLLRQTKAALAANQPLPQGVKLVVTSVGGRTTDVSPRLKGLGVEHRASPAPEPAKPGATEASTITPAAPVAAKAAPKAPATPKAPKSPEAQQPTQAPAAPKTTKAPAAPKAPVAPEAPAAPEASTAGKAPATPKAPAAKAVPATAPVHEAPEAAPPVRTGPRAPAGEGLGLDPAAVAHGAADIIIFIAMQRLQEEQDERNAKMRSAELEKLQPEMDRRLAGLTDEARRLQAAGKRAFVNVTLLETYQSDDEGLTFFGGVRLLDMKVSDQDIQESYQTQLRPSGVGEFIRGFLQWSIGHATYHVTYSWEFPPLKQPGASPPP